MSCSTEGEIKRLLSDQPNPIQLRHLTQFVFDELHRIAAGHLRGERPDRTLGPTALVNQAWIRLLETSDAFKNKAYFFCAASTAMRRILIEQARRRQTLKRGFGWSRVDVDDVDQVGFSQETDLLEFESLLSRLEAFQPRWSQIVELHLFGGWGLKETAEILGMGESTARQDWSKAKKWLRREMAEPSSAAS